MIIDKACGNSGNRSSRSGIGIAKSSGTLTVREALERKSGARDLLAIMEPMMLDLM
jgi:hypothetical protein